MDIDSGAWIKMEQNKILEQNAGQIASALVMIFGLRLAELEDSQLRNVARDSLRLAKHIRLELYEPTEAPKIGKPTPPKIIR